MATKQKYSEYLGKFCKDKITGIEGVCTSVVQVIHNVDQITIQPQAKDKTKFEDGYSFDILTVEVLKKPAVAKAIPYTINDGIELGDEVKDTLTDITGTVTRRYIQLNGCVHYAILDKKVNRNNAQVEHFITQHRLVAVKAAVAKKTTVQKVVEAVTKPKAKTTVAQSTGGPALKAPRL